MLSIFRTRGRFATVLGSLLLVAAMALVGCGPPTKHEIVKKAEGVETKQELESALGAPDGIEKLGPIERWTYSASDGAVEYVITGDAVALESTREKKEEMPSEHEPGR
jgi:hypothetical protein